MCFWSIKHGYCGMPARLVKSSKFVKGAWAMVFLDDADRPGSLGYHELTPDGFPLAKVFVRTTLKNGELVSVSASHELVEMLVDPALNMMTTGPKRATVYAYESADPVEELSFPVQGIPMSDFVYPSYFEKFRKAGSTKFDHLGKVRRPFQVLAGGYQIVMKDGKMSQITGSLAKKRRLAKEDRRGHRSQVRRQRRRTLTRSSKAEIARSIHRARRRG